MPSLLNIPYHSQLNNALNPSGACNVTSIAMCLSYLGYNPKRRNEQLEDFLYGLCDRHGFDRHSPWGLKDLVECCGYSSGTTEKGTLQQIRDAIDAGQPCVIHGYFTYFGHIVAVAGYDDRGLIVNDPVGEWYESGYDYNKSGERLHYSYELISRVCSPESIDAPKNIWLHRISRRKTA